MQEDVLDLFGDRGRDTAGSDLREGKISAMVVENLALHPANRDWLLGLLHQPRAATDAAIGQPAFCRWWRLGGGAAGDRGAQPRGPVPRPGATESAAA